MDDIVFGLGRKIDYIIFDWGGKWMISCLPGKENG